MNFKNCGLYTLCKIKLSLCFQNHSGLHNVSLFFLAWACNLKLLFLNTVTFGNTANSPSHYSTIYKTAVTIYSPNYDWEEVSGKLKPLPHFAT